MGARAAGAVGAGQGRRFRWLVVALAASSVLAIARALEPHADGLGTHRALGIAPCMFLTWFELPCPTCGMTTAFAHLARGQLFASLRAHPLGLPLFALTALTPVLALRHALRGDSLAHVVERHRLDHVALGLALVLVATWFARVAPLITR
jgi:hypothetical protein